MSIYVALIVVIKSWIVTCRSNINDDNWILGYLSKNTNLITIFYKPVVKPQILINWNYCVQIPLPVHILIKKIVWYFDDQIVRLFKVQYVLPQKQTVVVEGGFDAGARFGAGATPNIPVSVQITLLQSFKMSGGSRISKARRQSLRGDANLLFDHFSPKTARKWNFGPERGHASLVPPPDPPLNAVTWESLGD